MSVERDLFRLLHHRSVRAAWRADRSVLHVALSSLDAEEVERAAAHVLRGVRTRRWRGAGGLTDSFAASVARWRAAHDDPELIGLIGGFLESEDGEAWRDDDPAARCLEDHFGSWLSRQPGLDANEVAAERIAAVARALLTAPGAFAAPPDFEVVPGGWLAEHAGVAVAAAFGRFVRGPTLDVRGWLSAQRS